MSGSPLRNAYTRNKHVLRIRKHAAFGQKDWTLPDLSVFWNWGQKAPSDIILDKATRSSTGSNFI
jgi:hypothetical protein